MYSSSRVNEARGNGRPQSLGAARERLAAELAGGWSQRRYGPLAGFLILAAVLAALPNYFFLKPHPGPVYWVIAVAALALAAFCFRAPWARLPTAAFHAIAAAATLLIIASTYVTDLQLEGFYIFIVIFVAFVMPSRRDAVVWVSICGLALFAPVVWKSGPGVDQTLRFAALAIPRLVVTAAVLVYLREQYEAEHARLERFAAEVIELTARLERVGRFRSPQEG